VHSTLGYLSPVTYEETSDRKKGELKEVV